MKACPFRGGTRVAVARVKGSVPCRVRRSREGRTPARRDPASAARLQRSRRRHARPRVHGWLHRRRPADPRRTTLGARQRVAADIEPTPPMSMLSWEPGHPGRSTNIAVICSCSSRLRAVRRIRCAVAGMTRSRGRRSHPPRLSEPPSAQETPDGRQPAPCSPLASRATGEPRGGPERDRPCTPGP